MGYYSQTSLALALVYVKGFTEHMISSISVTKAPPFPSKLVVTDKQTDRRNL